jgi:hypothetical protein
VVSHERASSARWLLLAALVSCDDGAGRAAGPDARPAADTENSVPADALPDAVADVRRGDVGPRPGGADAGPDAGGAGGGGALAPPVVLKPLVAGLTGVRGVAPSPDGRTVYFTRLEADAGAVYAVAADGGPPALVTRGLRLPTALVVSPDGGMLYVVDLGLDTPGARGGALRAVPAAGGEPRTLESTRGTDPRGLDLRTDDTGATRLAFTGRAPRGETGSVFVLNLPDDQVRPLAEASPLREPGALVIEPADTPIVVDGLGTPDAAPGLFRLGAAGPERLAFAVPPDADVHLARSGDRLFVLGPVPGDRRPVLRVHDLTGGETQTLELPAQVALAEACGLRLAHAARVLVACAVAADGTSTVFHITGPFGPESSP